MKKLSALADENRRLYPVFVICRAFKLLITGEGLCKLKQTLEAIGIEAAFAGIPIHVFFHVQHEEALKDVAAAHIHTKGQIGVRMLLKYSLHFFHCPAHFRSRNIGRGNDGDNGEAAGELIKLSVRLSRLDYALNEIASVKVGVAVYVGIEILKQSLGGILLAGKLRNINNVGDMTGDYLGVELGNAGSPVFLGVVLGVVLNLDAVVGVALIEL